MQDLDHFKYYVIEFLELPYKDIKEYVCIPNSWIRFRRATDRRVIVSYPVENPLNTEKRVRKMQTISGEWKLYMANLKYGTDLYRGAKNFIKQKLKDAHYENKCSNIKNGDRKLSAQSAKKKRKSIQNTKSYGEMDIPLESKGSSKDGETPVIQTNPDVEVDNKRSKVIDSAESVSEVEKRSYQAIKCLNDNQLSSAPDQDIPIQKLGSQEIHVDKSYNENCVQETKHLKSIQNRPSVTKSFPNSINSSLDPLTRDERLMRSTDFLSIIRGIYESFSNTAHTMKNILDSHDDSSSRSSDISTASLSKHNTAEVAKISEKKNNDEKEDGDDNDNDEILEGRRKRKRSAAFVLPPEYDENDSRWTLKHRKSAPGLVELMPHTRVYINAVKLGNCKRLSRDCKTLARMLLVEIFNTTALSTCSLTGARAKAFDFEGTYIRPGLDEHARTVLLTFVEEYGSEKGWITSDTQSILNSIRNKMQEMRSKYNI